MLELAPRDAVRGARWPRHRPRAKQARGVAKGRQTSAAAEWHHSYVAKCEQWVAVVDRSGKAREITLHYRSGDPLSPDEFGVMHFTCGLVDSDTELGISEDDWVGMAQGVVRPPEPQGDGTVKVSIRNVLTFPAR